MSKKLRPGTKKYKVLKAFSSGKSLHRFKAERTLSDHVLPSTVSELERHGIKFDRKTIAVPGYQGAKTHVTQYWLEPDQQRVARQLLGGR